MSAALSTVVALGLLLVLGCGSQAEAPPGVDVEPMAVEGGGTILSDPAPDEDGTLRVLVYHDMEGLSGQDDPNTFRFSHPDRYAVGREYLLADVNAVIEGLYAGGADKVHVVDAHGSGNPEPDIMLDRLDARAEMVFRDHPFRQYVDLVEPELYDAIAVVGMHAKTGSGGFASHTYTLGMDMLINGESITETEIIAFSWGRVGVPVIFASGDDKLWADLQTMPWIEYVITKTATSASTAKLRPVDEVHAELTAAAERALRSRETARSQTLATPVRAGLRAVPPADLGFLFEVPGIRYESGTVSFEAADFQAAYDGMIALIGVARGAYSDVLVEVLREHPDGTAILSAYSDALFQRWYDVESDRWGPQGEPTDDPVTPRRYHGAR